tara:strand:- start:170 stop:766 length:597 start_codon:yes stop_codon:yes gene_type:complete
MQGSFAHTLTFTDTHSQWTELRAVWNRGGHATTLRVQEIEQALPFSLKGVNTDNGPEYLNGHLIRYFKEREVVVRQSRSRPYHKNANARVEQKNASHVRPLLGYDRFADPDCVEDLNEILMLHSCWTNLFRPCMKLVSKVKVGTPLQEEVRPADDTGTTCAGASLPARAGPRAHYGDVENIRLLHVEVPGASQNAAVL